MADGPHDEHAEALDELWARLSAAGVPDAATATRHELRLAVAVADGRLHATTTLAGVVLCERDEPLPFGRDEVWTLIDLPDADARLARLGARLSAALFDADTLEQLTALLAAAVPGTVLEVVVGGDGPVHELPYELTRLADQRVLATVDGVRLTRAVDGVPAANHPPAAGPLKILVAVGAPEQTSNPPLDVEAEMQAIVSVVSRVGTAEITILEVAGAAEIAEALRRDAYHVLHLSAHGSPYGVELEDRDGNAVDVRAEDLVRALRRGGRPLPLIVLSSCGGAADADAGLAVTLLRHGADRVIAMQTSVTDRYATGLLTAVYRGLAEPGVPVAAALAVARAAMFDAAAVPAQVARRPEYAIPALFAASDGPLWDAAAPPAPLSNPTELPTGDGVRELLLGDLVGRRALLRTVAQTLRDELAGAPLVGGVALTGPAGIGKTAIAGRVVTRLRDDVDDPWTIVLHAGAWNPPALLAELAAAGIDLDDDAPAAIAGALRTRRLLLVFDDFEQNLEVGGGAFLDPGFGEVFATLAAAAERGKVLVTSRYPVPGDPPLSRVEVPPLSDAELGRLLLRMPGLRDLPGEDAGAVVQAVGGHPRLLEFVDVLLHGGARLPEVTARLRALTGPSGLSSAGRSAADAAREAIALGARDFLLAELLDLLAPDERAALLQLAVSRIPVAAEDLAFAVHDREPTAEDTAAMAGHLGRLRDLTLAGAAEDGSGVEPWLREALADRFAGDIAERHVRAAAACRRIIDAGRAGFSTATEAVYHLRAAGSPDELADLAVAVAPKFAGELSVAAFLGEVLPGLPDDHPAYAGLLARERDALETTGSTAAAAETGEEVLARAERAAQAAPGDADAQLELSSALDSQGRLLHRLGRLAAARRCYERALAVDLRLAEADPGVQYRRNVATSHLKIAETALDDAEIALAREAAGESLRIRRELADADPANPTLQWDLAAGLGVLAAVHREAGEPAEARTLHEQALDIWRKLSADDAEHQGLLARLFDCVSAIADLTGPADLEAFRALATEAATIADTLTTADSGNVDHQRKSIAAQWRLADMDLAAGDPDCAGQHVAAALETAQRLAGADPDDLDVQRDLGTALRRAADHADATGRPEEVRGQLERAEEVAELLAHRFPSNGALHRDLAEARERLAAWFAADGDPAQARAFYRQALVNRRRRAALDPEDTAAVAAQAAVLERIAELDDAAGQPARARRRREAARALVDGDRAG
ncbi:CHAT domain-containing protein [Dactylosporangium darangshiense]|uniref:CHAT domain-containing protein n=1 Tax=Dactylosporangium darangshiense TaxID=579108 RepID=A0ABP8DBQ7_9ACTN